MKGELAQQHRTAQLRSDEGAAANVLADEQQRWSAFNERLEELERALAATSTHPALSGSGR